MKIFLSAVSGQFRDVRVELTRDLIKLGHEPIVQEHFQQGGFTLLEKLEELVASCDKVVALVGTAYGFEAAEPARPAGFARRSYTQWEYFFAQGERLDGSKVDPKPILAYFAHEKYLADRPPDADEDAEQANLQRAFMKAIEDSGKHWSQGVSLDNFCRQIILDLAEPLPHSRTKPNNLLFSPLGTLFKGRDDFLVDLRAHLTGTKNGTITQQAIHGLGGVGKTRAAIEYAWKFHDHYSALLFVNAGDPSKLDTNLANLIGVLAVDHDPAAVEAQRLAEVHAWLRKNPRWLLILDNVDTEDAAVEAQRLLEKLAGATGDLLITSRISNWPAGVVPLELDVLREADAVAFLLERTRRRKAKPDDHEIAQAIAHDLGCLALALEQAGAYVDTLRISLAEYRKKWDESRLKVLGWHSKTAMNYPFSVAATWLTTFEKLGEPEKRLLQILAQMAPDPIPLTFFEAKTLKEAFEEPRETLAGLMEYSLVRSSEEEDAVGVHRLVQEVVRSRSREEERLASLRLAVESLNDLVPEMTDDVRTWPVWLPLASHADVVVWEADRAGISEPTARVMSQQGVFLKTQARFAEAEPLYRRALSIGEASHGAESHLVAVRTNNLAELLRTTNQLTEAEPLFRRSLALDETSLGQDHPVTMMRLNNLAELLRNMNRNAESEPLYLRALSISEKLNRMDHRDDAILHNNLAALYVGSNRLIEAEPLLRRALSIFEKLYGQDHPNVSTCLNNLAEILRVSDRLEDAELLYRRSLEIDERAYGQNHPAVAIKLNNLAELLRVTNRPNEAEPLFYRALTIYENSYGPDHPVLTGGLNNLAELLRATNRLEEAEPLYRRALVILLRFERQNNNAHPNFPPVVGNYWLVLEKRGLAREEIERQIVKLFEESS